MPCEQFFQLLSIEPFFPCGRFQAAPLLDVFVDNYYSSFPPNNTADLRDGGLNFHDMLERLGCIGAVKRPSLERESRHRTRAGCNALRDKVQHGLGQIEGVQPRQGIAFSKDAGKPALPTTSVQHSFAAQFPEVLEDHLHMVNTRVERRGKMFFISGGLVEMPRNLARCSSALRR